MLRVLGLCTGVHTAGMWCSVVQCGGSVVFGCVVQCGFWDGVVWCGVGCSGVWCVWYVMQCASRSGTCMVFVVKPHPCVTQVMKAHVETLAVALVKLSLFDRCRQLSALCSSPH